MSYVRLSLSRVPSSGGGCGVHLIPLSLSLSLSLCPDLMPGLGKGVRGMTRASDRGTINQVPDFDVTGWQDNVRSGCRAGPFGLGPLEEQSMHA
jgi:hypothetical protein